MRSCISICSSLSLLLSLLLCSCSSIVVQSIPSAPSKVGLLRVLSSNPRYFSDGTGKAVYLTGSHERNNVQTLRAPEDPLGRFDFPNYLNLLQQNNHNFIRGWAQEDAAWLPLPYLRTGPGNAVDGQPKFDLTKFNQKYFDQLRTRAIQAGQRGLYISIMLFNGWSVNNSFYVRKINVWAKHPFNNANNINGIDGDLNGDGEGSEIHTLTVPASITSLQEAYVRKVVDTLADLENVLFEISNESKSDSKDWQYHMINFIHTYQTTREYKNHPVGMTPFWDGIGMNPVLFASPADWISPNAHASGDPAYKDNPPPADGSKVIITDTDHTGLNGDESIWIWKSFTRGLNPIVIDARLNGFKIPADSHARATMGYARSYANRMDLAAMTPQTSLSSSGYALANPGNEYLFYQPESNTAFTANLLSGVYKYEWFNPGTGSVVSADRFTTLDGSRLFIAPFTGDAVLYLKKEGD